LKTCVSTVSIIKLENSSGIDQDPNGNVIELVVPEKATPLLENSIGWYTYKESNSIIPSFGLKSIVPFPWIIFADNVSVLEALKFVTLSLWTSEARWQLLQDITIAIMERSAGTYVFIKNGTEESIRENNIFTLTERVYHQMIELSGCS